MKKRPAGATPPTLSRSCRLMVRFRCIAFRCFRWVASCAGLMPLRSGMAEPYRGSLTIRNLNEPSYPLV
jgi:hypothetical protein